MDDDTFIAGLVDEGMAGYDESVLPPDVLERMRAALYDYFAFHPEGQRLAQRARPEPDGVDCRGTSRE